MAKAGLLQTSKHGACAPRRWRRPCSARWRLCTLHRAPTLRCPAQTSRRTARPGPATPRGSPPSALSSASCNDFVCHSMLPAQPALPLGEHRVRFAALFLHVLYMRSVCMLWLNALHAHQHKCSTLFGLADAPVDRHVKLCLHSCHLDPCSQAPVNTCAPKMSHRGLMLTVRMMAAAAGRSRASATCARRSRPTWPDTPSAWPPRRAKSCGRAPPVLSAPWRASRAQACHCCLVRRAYDTRPGALQPMRDGRKTLCRHRQRALGAARALRH